jgi:hypothetical protein
VFAERNGRGKPPLESNGIDGLRLFRLVSELRKPHHCSSIADIESGLLRIKICEGGGAVFVGGKLNKDAHCNASPVKTTLMPQFQADLKLSLESSAQVKLQYKDVRPRQSKVKRGLNDWGRSQAA